MVFMKSKYLSSYCLIPFFLVQGGGASFAREVAFAYTLDKSSEAGVFRMVYTFPNYFVRSAGTVFTHENREKVKIIIHAKVSRSVLVILMFISYLGLRRRA